MTRPEVTIYTDGGCHPNPGPGGWGAVILGPGERVRELSGSAPDSTNNRMELTAAVESLRSLDEPSTVELVTDSRYLENGITRWIDGWRRKGWKTAAKKPVKNQDLWKALDAAAGRHEVEWRWTRGHAGDRWNERAHELAAEAIERPDLPLGDRDAVHAFLGVAWSGKKRTGAWGAVLCHRDRQKELSGRVPGATSNATHIASAVGALEAMRRPVGVHVYTVSDYLRDGATRWLPAWKRRGWTTREGKPVASRSWWQRLSRLLDKVEARWHVVPGDDPPPEVEMARELAREALAGKTEKGGDGA